MVKNLIQEKGVNIATEFNEFKDTLFNKKVLRHKIKRIQSKKHKLGTYKIHKKSLSCFDDKRFVLDDGIHTQACFHKRLKACVCYFYQSFIFHQMIAHQKL